MWCSVTGSLCSCVGVKLFELTGSTCYSKRECFSGNKNLLQIRTVAVKETREQDMQQKALTHPATHTQFMQFCVFDDGGDLSNRIIKIIAPFPSLSVQPTYTWWSHELDFITNSLKKIYSRNKRNETYWNITFTSKTGLIIGISEYYCSKMDYGFFEWGCEFVQRLFSPAGRTHPSAEDLTLSLAFQIW